MLLYETRITISISSEASEIIRLLFRNQKVEKKYNKGIYHRWPNVKNVIEKMFSHHEKTSEERYYKHETLHSYIKKSSLTDRSICRIEAPYTLEKYLQ